MFARDNCMNLYPPNTHPSMDKGKAQRERA